MWPTREGVAADGMNAFPITFSMGATRSAIAWLTKTKRAALTMLRMVSL